MESKRLDEIKLGIHINNIDRTSDAMMYRELLRVLSCVAISLGAEENKALSELAQMSVCKGFARATDKELIATIKKYFKPTNACKKMGCSFYNFKNKYDDLLNRNYDNEEYLKSLQPIIKSSNGQVMVRVLNTFIDKFKIPTELYNKTKFEEMDRTLEIDFVLIYEKLMQIFNNYAFVDKLIFNLCNAFEIDYPTIAHLKNNVHVMNRTFPNFRYNHRYFMQEIYTLFSARGYTKGAIGSQVLQKGTQYLHTACGKNYAKAIPEEDLAWQYIPTIEWKNLDKASVHKFIQVLRDFVRYDV